jgi:hypothetical protein
LILAKFPPAGIGRFNQSGKRLDPGIEVCSRGAVRKSEREGPEFRVSVNDVVGRRVREGEMVARARIDGFEGREVRDWVLDISVACSRRGRHFVKVRMMSRWSRRNSTSGDTVTNILTALLSCLKTENVKARLRRSKQLRCHTSSTLISTS